MKIFGEILMIFGDIIEEFWRKWLAVRRFRTSVNQRIDPFYSTSL